MSSNEDIKEIIYDRIYKIYKEILPRDKKYQELREKSAEILEQLLESLSGDEKEKLSDYDEALTLQMSRQDALIYSRGLVDGILLGYWIDRARQEPEKFLFELGFTDQES
jgi:hypothetical protein